jgi:hypothetical protein
MIDIVEVLVIISFEGELKNCNPTDSIVNKAPSDRFFTINIRFFPPVLFL